MKRILAALLLLTLAAPACEQRDNATAMGRAINVLPTTADDALHELKFEVGLNDRQATAVWSTLRELLLDSYDAFLDAHLPFVASDKRFVIDYEASPSAANFDLNVDGEPETFVYADLWGFCGSGGCTTYVLHDGATGWRVIGKFFGCTLVVSEGLTNGFRDLVERDCRYSLPDRVYKFDGREYREKQ